MEVWKTIPEYPNYEISSMGRVRSKTYIICDCVGHEYTHNGRILRPCLAGKGYETVILRVDKKSVRVYIHQLVATIFIEKPPSHKMLIVNHKDGNKRNNDVRNLEWVTYTDNNRHAYDSNLKKRGSQFYNAKLSENDVIQIRNEFPKVQNLNYFAKKYHVSRATIRDVINRKTWKAV